MNKTQLMTYATRLFYFLIFWSLCLASKAQIADDFTSDELGVSWIVQRESFTVTGGKLRSNGPNSNNQNIYLVQTIVGNPELEALEWRFTVDLGFAPSSTNLLRYYLLSNVLTLSGSLQGYYIEIGESNQDTITLFRQSGGVRTRVAASDRVCYTSATANYSNVRVRVTRTVLGGWEVSSDCQGGENFQTDFSVVDNTFQTGTFFGVNCVYATASRYNLYNIDDVYMGPLIVDVQPPSVIGVTLHTLSTLGVQFSEPIDVQSASILQKYNLGVYPVSVTVSGSISVLTFQPALQPETAYNLSITGIADLASNTLSGLAIVSFTTPGIGQPPGTVPGIRPLSFREIVINEIMADVNPAPSGLPAVDFIELYNTSGERINLQGLVLRDFTSTGSFTDRTITGVATVNGNGYIILCSIAARNSLLGANLSGPFVTFSSLDPSNEDRFHLIDAFGNIIDSIRYTASWYKDGSKSSGGWSLEQRNPTTTLSSDINNWAASVDVRGGTPGEQNSIYSLLPPIPGVALQPGDIVINEIMADPSPPTNLPEVEYLELYNRLNRPIALRNFTLVDGTVNRVINQNITIPALGYIVLVSNSSNRTLLIESVSSNIVFTLSGLSLGNANDNLVLKDALGNEIDQVSYTDSWYKDASKKSGGYSLERIRPHVTCSGTSNWTATRSENGGTPGAQNSVFLSDNSIEAMVSSTRALPGLGNVFEIHFDQQISNSFFAFQSSAVSIQQFGVKPVGGDILAVTLSGSLFSGQGVIVTISGVRACASELVTSVEVQLVNGAVPQPGDLIFTEIMADETPVVGLPEAEYVEIYNRSNKWLQLQGSLLKDATSTTTITGSVFLAPRSYLILCSSTKVQSFTGYGQTLGLSGFPSLNNSGEMLMLINRDWSIIDAVTYSSTWYKDHLKKDGGYSLERYALYEDCGTRSNWQASADPSGGTPGRPNSITQENRVESGLSVTGTRFINSNTLEIAVSEYIRPSSFAQAQVTPLNVSSLLKGLNSDTISLIFPVPFIDGRTYAVTFAGLNTCLSSNPLVLKVDITKGKKPNYQDVVINEFLADVSPSVGLPGFQFVEIYNRSLDIIDIGGVVISDRSSGGKIPAGTLIYPNSYKILCGSSGFSEYKLIGDAVSVPSFPSLNISGDLIQLKSDDGQIIDEINYTSGWYTDQIKKEGGYSLERIDVNRKCGGSLNWAASNDERGGTPGRINSIAAQNPDSKSPEIKTIYLKLPDTLVVVWNEDLRMGAPATVRFQDQNFSAFPQNTVVNFVIQNWLPETPYRFYIQPTVDCEGNPSNSLDTTLYLFLNAQKGDIKINELYFNPPVGGFDYIEVINTAPKPVQIQGLKLARLNKGNVEGITDLVDTYTLLASNEVLAVTTNVLWTKNQFPKSADGNILEKKSIPAMNDDSGEIVLLSSNDSIFERVYYEEKFHNKLIEKREGISLERIRFDIDATKSLAWTSASASLGYGTPGKTNSQSSIQLPNADAVLMVQPEIFSPDQDGFEDLTHIMVQIENTGGAYTLYVQDIQGRRIKTLAFNAIAGTRNEHLWDGTDNSGSVTSIGPYIMVVEITDLNSNTISRFQKRVVVATRF